MDGIFWVVTGGHFTQRRGEGEEAQRGRFFWDRIAGWAGFTGFGEGVLGGAGPGEEEEGDEG